MKSILVSGASGIVGYGILRSIRKFESSYRLIGTTIYEDSPASGFCDVFEKAIPTNDDNYIEWLCEVIKKHNVALLIPGIEADMYKWADNLERIENSGAKILINNLELLSLCVDKWKFYKNLSAFDSVYAIESSLSNDFDLLKEAFGIPFLLKPRRGFGSKGIVIVSDKNIFDHNKHLVGDTLMAQPIVGNNNEEYTTSAFCDGNGGFFAFMTLRRKLSSDGFTDKAEVVHLTEIEPAISFFCSIYKPLGPTNFQFRMHNGVLKLLEINPRISSSTSIRSSFGYNESRMAIEYFLENKPISQPIIRNGRAVRYFEDLIFYS